MNIFEEINETLGTNFTKSEILNLELDIDYLESLNHERIDFCYDPEYFSGYTRTDMIEEILADRINILNWINVFQFIKPLNKNFIDLIWSRIKNKYNDSYKYGIIIKAIVSNNIVSNNFIINIFDECILSSKYDIIKYILRNQKLEEPTLDKYMEILDEDECNVEICTNQNLSENFIEKYYEILDLELVIKYQKISKDFIISHEELLELAITKRIINEDELELIWGDKISNSKYLKKIISKNYGMSREFINHHGTELDWNLISRNTEISIETLIYYKCLIYWNAALNTKRKLKSNELKKLITENIITDIQSICEIMNSLDGEIEFNKFCKFFREYLKENKDNED